MQPLCHGAVRLESEFFRNLFMRKTIHGQTDDFYVGWIKQFEEVLYKKTVFHIVMNLVFFLLQSTVSGIGGKGDLCFGAGMIPFILKISSWVVNRLL